MHMEKRSWNFERNIIDGPLKYFCRVAYWALVEMLLLDCSRTPWGLWNLCNFSGSVDPLDLTAVPHPRFPVQVQVLSASGYADGLYIVLCTSGWCSTRPLGLMFYEQQLVKYPTSNLELVWSLPLRKLPTEIGSKNYVRELMGPSTAALLLLKSTRWVLAQRRTVIRSGFAYWRRSAAVWPRLVSSKGEPPLLVPMRCSKVPPLSGTGGAPADDDVVVACYTLQRSFSRIQQKWVLRIYSLQQKKTQCTYQNANLEMRSLLARISCMQCNNTRQKTSFSKQHDVQQKFLS